MDSIETVNLAIQEEGIIVVSYRLHFSHISWSKLGGPINIF